MGSRCAVALVVLTLAGGAVQGEDPPRTRVGLALGGGAAKGFAHTGVLQWLEEHRIPVDAIAGTSTGASIGGAYAIGMSAAEIQALLRSTDWERVMQSDVPYPLKSFRRKQDARAYPIKLDAGLRHGLRLQSGLNPGHGVGLLLSRIALPYSSVGSFDDLAISFRCVATDLETGEAVVLDRGPLGPALRASMALPGTFDTVRLRGRLLSDGGILDSVPVDVARGMGVDVVIAVAMDRLKDEKPPETISGVANRAIDLMMRSLEQPRLQRADVVIVPDLEGLRSSDYAKSDALAARGYAAAAEQSDALLRYALDAEAWERHQAAVKQRRRPRTGTLSFVEVTGVSEPAAAQIVRRIQPDLSEPPDPTTIEAHLDWVVGSGRYASAMYDRRFRGDREGLGIEIRDKSYAPPFVKFSLDIDNENRDTNLSFGSRVTFMDATSLGSEWRLDASVGSTLRVASELFQPLGDGGPVRRGAFLAPRALYSRTSESFYVDDALQAILSRQRVGAGLDLGWIFGRNTELRAGYQASYVRNVARVGDAFEPSTGPEQAASVRFAHEGQDRAYFPSRGLRFTSRTTWTWQAPGAERGFGRAEAAISAAWRITHRNHASFYASGGASFGETPPILYQFDLGGPFRLGAFPSNTSRGPKLLLGGVAYRTPLARLPKLLGDRLYLTGFVEAGSVFDRLRGAQFKSSFSGGLAAETLLGPVFVGGSVGNGGAFRAYFIVGALVR